MNIKFSMHWTILLAGTLLISACTTPVPAQTAALEPPAVTTDAVTTPMQPAAPPSEAQEAAIPTGWGVETFAQDLEIPWSIVFTSDDRMLVAERTGAVRQIIDGNLAAEPIYVFDAAQTRDEAGLMGLALHPEYAQNKYLYACYATTGSGLNLIARVDRLIDSGDSLQTDRVIVDNIPAARFHAGCRLQFGPDNMLYISTGDATNKNLPQDIDSSGGKILRVTPEGDVPSDNPFPGSPVYSLGHRNPQGLTWDLENSRMFSTEHGPSGFDGPGGGDEINMIVAGGNYGWPLGSHDTVPEGTIGPMIQFTPAEAPASALFYNDDALPFFKGSLFFGALRGEGLVRVTFIEGQDNEVLVDKIEKIIDDVGRVRDVITGPDGSIYFTTSNRDGRGTIVGGDDKIYRIFPIF